jgi:putative PIN family toxin of toxin-antitoxin system
VLRVVLDPGVLVSAVLGSTGPPAELLDRWREGEFDMVASPALLGELEEVLLRPKFRHAALEDEVRTYVDALAREGVLILDPEQIPAITVDPADDYLVALAAAAGADAIVSSDKDLTELVDPPVPVLTPRELLQRLERT